ncbi:hypothetical protein RCH12_003237 [Cryobacterium sp. MP_3.1]|nr:hypothetical protein [Cryobacterium sp. MP_3.1]
MRIILNEYLIVIASLKGSLRMSIGSSTLTPRRAQRTLGFTVFALAAAFSLALGVSTPSFAATGAQTGEWDVVATSNTQSPKLKSYEHEAAVWDTVSASSASFSVGSGKVIDESESATTPVSGGGIRFENTATTSKKVTFTFAVPANVGLKIQAGSSAPIVNTVAASGVRTATFVQTVAAGTTFHGHYTWTFSGSGTATAANIGVTAAITAGASGGSTVGNYSASQTYRFTF